MAPKGMKRPAAASPSADVASKVAKVAKALKATDSLSSSLTTMLAGMAGACLSTPKEERHPFEASLVDMIGETLKGIESSISEEVSETKAKVDACSSDKDARVAALAQTEKDLVELKQTVVDRKAALAEETARLGEAQAALKEAKKRQAAVDAAREVKVCRKASIVLAHIKYLSVVNAGADGAVSRRSALNAIVKLGKELGFDPVLLDNLPGAVRKAPAERSASDNETVGQLEQEFVKHIDLLTKLVDDDEADKGQRVEAVAAAKATHDAQAEKKKASERALEEAKVAEKAGAAAVKLSENAVASWFPDTQRVMDKYDDLTHSQVEFSTGALALFEELRVLAPPPPPPAEEETPAPAAELAPAEAPTEPAEAPTEAAPAAALGD